MKLYYYSKSKINSVLECKIFDEWCCFKKSQAPARSLPVACP